MASWRNTTDRYGWPMMVLHWATLALIIAIYALVLLREEIPKDNPLRGELMTWHKQLGMTVFGLVWLRLALRLSNRTPAITPPPPAWQMKAAHAMHLALYVFLIVQPLLGWLMSGAAGRPLTVFGFVMPALIGPNKALAEALGEVHETIGNLGYLLIGVHAAAALAHAYVLKDNTLRRILPAAGR